MARSAKFYANGVPVTPPGVGRALALRLVALLVSGLTREQAKVRSGISERRFNEGLMKGCPPFVNWPPPEREALVKFIERETKVRPEWSRPSDLLLLEVAQAKLEMARDAGIVEYSPSEDFTQD